MLTVKLPYPISANRYWRTRVIKPKAGPAIVSTYVSAEAKAFKEEVALLLRVAGVRQPIPGRIAIAYTLYPHRPLDWKTRQRKHGAAWDDTVQCLDLDNAQKVLLDAMKGIAFEDDAWVRRITAERAEPDGEARVIVTITPIVVEQPQAELPICAISQTGVSRDLFDPLEV